MRNYNRTSRDIRYRKYFKFHKDLIPDTEQLQQALNDANQCSGKYNIPVIAAVPCEHCILETQHLQGIHFSTCVCGSAKWVIDPEGNLRTCEQSPVNLGNLFTDGFAILSSSSEVQQFRDANRFAHCKTKTCYPVCGGGCRFNR